MPAKSGSAGEVITQRVEFSVAVHVSDPRIITAKGKPALQFRLSLYSGDEELWNEPGWRLMSGQIFPPSKRVGQYYHNVSYINSGAFEAALGAALHKWAVLFPSVAFPGEEKSESTSPENVPIDFVLDDSLCSPTAIRGHFENPDFPDAEIPVLVQRRYPMLPMAQCVAYVEKCKEGLI